MLKGERKIYKEKEKKASKWSKYDLMKKKRNKIKANHKQTISKNSKGSRTWTYISSLREDSWGKEKEVEVDWRGKEKTERRRGKSIYGRTK